MALTSAGFDGTIDEQSWATMSALNGAQYAVAGVHDFEVTPRTGATLTVNVAAGTAFGRGVTVTNSAQITVALDAIASGTRWDAIVIRRTWTSNTVTVDKITGTATRAVPAGRNNTPGTLDDQVIGLVQVTAGNSVPTAVVDMRVWQSKVMMVADLLAITNPILGMEAVVLGTGTQTDLLDRRWRYSLDATSNPAWELDSTSLANRPLTISDGAGGVATAQTGFSVGTGLLNEATRDRNTVQLDLEIRRTGARIASDANGGLADVNAIQIDAKYWPSHNTPVHFTYYGGPVGSTTVFQSFSGSATLNTAGMFTINSLAPNIYLNQVTDGTSCSIRAHVTFLQRAQN